MGREIYIMTARFLCHRLPHVCDEDGFVYGSINHPCQNRVARVRPSVCLSVTRLAAVVRAVDLDASLVAARAVRVAACMGGRAVAHFFTGCPV